MRTSGSSYSSVRDINMTKIVFCIIVCILTVSCEKPNDKVELQDSELVKAVQTVIQELTDDDKQAIRSVERLKLVVLYYTWGNEVRSQLQLKNRDSKLVGAICGKPCEPADATMIVIYAVWSELNNLTFERDTFLKEQNIQD